MAIKMNAFDQPKRPSRLTVWGPTQVVVALSLLGICACLTGTWLSLFFVAYMIIVEGVFAMREWLWNRYADQTEQVWRDIAAASQTLGAQLEAIAAKVEAGKAAKATEPSTPAPKPLQWTATSRGVN